MVDLYLPNLAGGSVNQTVDVRKRTAILDDFAHQEAVHNLETREIKVLWFVQHQRRDTIVESAPRVAEPRVLFIDVMTVNNIVVLAL
jgi:hypothetical protein